MAVANTLAYYDSATITFVKSFIETEPCGQYYKTFLGVIYATSGIFLYGFDWVYTDSDRPYYNGKLLALLANIRLGWKWMVVTNALAYYDSATIIFL